MSYLVLPKLRAEYEIAAGFPQTGCQHCGGSGYDRTYQRCSDCGLPWAVGSNGRHWRTGELPPPEFMARFRARPQSVPVHALSGPGCCMRLPAWYAGVGDGAVWPSDLIAYRQQWEPFIAAHLNLWRYLNSIFEQVPATQQCPAGIFTTIPPALDAGMQQFCASLALTRIRISETDPGGILPQWNAWAGKSSAEILAGAPSMLKWHQDVVLRVGGEYKSDLVRIAQLWNIRDIELPPVPEFSAQQSIIARIEGDGLAAQGLLQIIGYSAGKVLVAAATTSAAVAEGLRDTAKAIPSVFRSPWTWIGITGVVAVVGSALIVHYLPAPERRAEGHA